jgi:hypothetical protein
MKLVQKIGNYIRWFTPYGIIKIYRDKNIERDMERDLEEYQKRCKKESDVRNYFLSLNKNEQSAEITEIIEYLEKYKISMIPYEFTRKYHVVDIDAFYDISCKMYFVLHNGKKLYFPRNYKIEQVVEIYRYLCIEQDIESPHRYETKDYKVKAGDVIADIGAAEGIWALDNAEAAGKIYLFEREQKWIEALRKTFEPWKEKVVIINKYVSNTNGKEKITLDEFFKEKTINFIKADIEGSEIALVEGSKILFLKNNDLKLLLCTYHKEGDDKKLKEMLENASFMTEYSNRHILVSICYEEWKQPYIRHGVIRAKKNPITLSS